MNFKTNKEKGNSGLGMAIAYLFVLNEKSEMYLIPKDKIFNKSTLNLCDKYIEYKVKI